MKLPIVAVVVVLVLIGGLFAVANQPEPIQPVIPETTFDAHNESIVEPVAEPVAEPVVTEPVNNTTTNTSISVHSNHKPKHDLPVVQKEPVLDTPVINEPPIAELVIDPIELPVLLDDPVDTSFQGLINACEVGGTIYLNNETYYENIVINKSCNIIGNNTIIDGMNLDDALRIVADNVNITGMSFTNSSYCAWCGGGIDIVDAFNIRISNCSFYGNAYAGIRLYDVTNSNFSNCMFYGNLGEGLFMEYCSDIVIKNCTVIGVNNPIRVDHYSYNISIIDCVARDGASFYLMQGAYDCIIRNCISYNNTYGLSLIEGNDANPPYNNTIIDCSFIKNSIGIRINGGFDNLIQNCTFISNEVDCNDKTGNRWV